MIDYFVSIENCQFFRWQIELLYESMKPYGLEKNLVIGCANLENKPLRFPKVFYHENVGRSNNYLPLNKTFALWTALENNLLKQPFVVIDPDMIMNSPMIELDVSYAHFCTYLAYENLLSFGYDGFGIKKEDWCAGGVVYYFNNCDNSILKNIHKDLFRLLATYNNKGLKNGLDYWQREMVAFAIALSRIKAEAIGNLQSYLNSKDSGNFSFIHYCNGLQPFFNKRTHNNMRPFSISSPLPFEAILSIPNVNSNVMKLKNVVRSYLQNNQNIEI
jgi:hypothetical protein